MSFLPIRVSTIKSGIKLGFDVYVQLPHKVLKYAQGLDDIESHRILYLKDKKVRKLYINESDEGKYQEYVDRCLKELMTDNNVSTDEKANLVVGAGESAAEKMYEDPHSKKSYDAAQSTASSLISVLSQNDDLLKGIFDKTISEEDDNYDARMQKHSVNTSSICISFAEFLGLPKPSIELLGLAGLFHDVAYSQYKDEEKHLFFKNVKDMSAPELTLYKEHPKTGGEILQDKDFANKDLINLMMAHEEKRGGNGFPNKLTTLTVEQEVLSIGAFYDRCITCLKMSRADVLDDFKINQIGNYDLDMINKFKSFVKKAGL